MDRENRLSNPYVGPRPFNYEDHEYFFGREREARDLSARLISEQVLLFYAQSGAGKSSLLNTRLIPQLREEEDFAVLPVGRVSGELPANLSHVTNFYLFNLMTSLDQSDINPQRLADLTLKQFLAQLSSDDGYHWYYQESPSDSEPMFEEMSKDTPEDISEDMPEEVSHTPQRYLLIIDQFEEIITTQSHLREEREEFFRQLNRAVVDDPNLWVLLTLRSDYVAALDPYAHLMAERLQARFYMERMEKQAALDAVKKPAAKQGRPFATEVAEKLVDNLRRVKVFGQAEEQLGQSVEPVQLQVVCYQIWERLSVPEDADAEITFDDLGDLSTTQGTATLVDEALQNYYEYTLKAVLNASDASVSERQLRDWFSTQLITPGETRNLLPLSGDDNSVAGLPHVVVTQLADRYLVRAESRAGGVWYELAHDRFIHPIVSANREWLLRQINPVTTAARIWDTNHRHANYLLRSQQLVQAEQYASTHPNQLGELEQAFLDSCQQEQTKERVRRNQYFALAMVAATFMVLLVLLNALHQNRVIASLMAANHSSLKADTETDTALLLAAQAYALDKSSGTRSQLHYATARSYEPLQALLSEHKEQVWGVAYSPNGEFIATASNDSKVILWDAETFQIRNTLRARQENLVFYRVAVHPDNGLVVAGASGGNLLIWDSQTGKVEQQLQKHSSAIYTLAFSPDGTRLATGGNDSKIIVWDTATWQPIVEETHDQGKLVWDIAFSPDGQTLASAGQDGIRLWKLTEIGTVSHRVALTQHRTVVTSIAFYPSVTSTILASGDVNGVIRFWDLDPWLQAGEEPLTSGPLQKHASGAYIWGLDFNPTGDILASATKFSTFRYWNIDLSAGVGNVGITPLSLFLDSHTGALVDIEFSPDGQRTVAASLDGNASVWQVNSGNLLTAQAGNPDSMILLDDAKTLLTSNSNGTVMTWSVESKQLIGEQQLEIISGTIALLSQDGSKLVAATKQGIVQLWNIREKKLIAQKKTDSESPISALAINQEGSLVATGQDNGAVSLWELKDGTTFEGGSIGEQGKVNVVAFNERGTLLASGGCVLGSVKPNLSCTGETIVWDTATGEPVGKPLTAERLGQITALAFAHKQDLLATGNSGGLVNAWDWTEHKITIENREHGKGAIKSLTFTPDDALLISAGPWGTVDSTTGTILLWDVENNIRFGRSLNEHDQGVRTLLVSPYGNSFYSAGPDNYIVVNSLDAKYWFRRACTIANRTLTDQEREQYLNGRNYRDPCGR